MSDEELKQEEQEEQADTSPYDTVRDLCDRGEQALENGMNAEVLAFFLTPDKDGEEDEESVSGHMSVISMCNEELCLQAAQVALTLTGVAVLKDRGVTEEHFDSKEQMDTAACLLGLRILTARAAQWSEMIRQQQEAAKQEEPPAPENEGGGRHYSETVEDSAGSSGGGARKPTHPGDNKVH